MENEKIQKILRKIYICEIAKRETINGHFSYKINERISGLSPLTIDVLNELNIQVTTNTTVYENYIKEARKELVNLNSIECDDIETLRKIRSKYVTAEDIKTKIIHDFTNYQEFLGFMEQNQEQLQQTRQFLDAKLSKLIHEQYNKK